MNTKRGTVRAHMQHAKLSTREIVITGLFAALIYASKMVMSGLPNIEPVSLLVILYTIYYPKLSPYVLAVFILLEGFTYGFGIWWASYLYLWPLLAVATYVLRKNQGVLVWSVLSGAFGLSFGALCSIPWAIAGGLSVGVAYWVSGIPFDLAHCAGNFTLMLVLYHPLSRCFARLPQRL